MSPSILIKNRDSAKSTPGGLQPGPGKSRSRGDGIPDAAPNAQVQQREQARVRRRRTRLAARDLETLTRNLSTQLEAGVPLLRALGVQAGNDTPDGPIVSEVMRSLQNGVSFSESLEQFPNAFPDVYRKLVASAEVSGSLPDVLNELADFLAWREGVKSLIRKASFYPATVLVACVLLIIFILGYVFPKFAPLFQKLGDDLPVAASMLMAAGDFVAARWVELLGGMAGSVVALLLLARSRSGARLILDFLARVPVIGPTLWAIELARFARNLSVTTHAGVDVVHGLELTKDAVGNSRLRNGLADIHSGILGGDNLTGAMDRSGLFEPMVLNMMAVGEESGRVPDVLARLADLHDRKAKDSVARMLAILEPMITVFLGVVVGGMAVTVIGTLYKAMAVAGK